MPQKLWKAGCADEDWKIMICAREAAMAEETISCLTYIVTDAGSDYERGIAILRSMSGAQIIDALLAYRESRRKAVENGIRHKVAGGE